MATTDFAPVFRVYDRWGGYVKTLADVRGATWDRQVGGADTLTLETGEEMAKGWRVVWADRTGTWHEHVADEPVASRQAGEPCYTTMCGSPLGDLRYRRIEDRVPSGSCARALQVALEGTGWSVGDTAGTDPQASRTLYRCSVLEAVDMIAERWGGEPYATVDVDAAGVCARYVNCPARQGADTGARLEYGRDLAGVRRTVSSDPVYTALYGYGRGEEVGDGNGRRITFAEANGGVDWVGDEEARQAWGVPGPGGERLHAFGEAVFEDVDDPAELLRLTRAALEECRQPKVTYELEWAAAAAAGLGRDVGPGDLVEFVDSCFDPPLRGSARVLRVSEDLFDPSAASVTLGNAADTLTSSLAGLGSSVAAIVKRGAGWDAAASASPGYVESVITRINALANAGLSYTISTPELGLMMANVPLDPHTGAPLGSPGGALSCVDLRAGTVRLATEHSGGAWRWRTAMAGGGIAADEITSGVLNADLLRAGVIMDATGNNFWNLVTGELRMAAEVDLPDLDGVITGVDVEYALGASQTSAPDSGWSTVAPAWQADKYMWQRTVVTDLDGVVTYSQPTCIQGAQGVAGTGVSAVVEQYYLSNSSTTQAGGSWSTAQPVWHPGAYIWTRSQVTWTDGTVTTTAPVLAKAINGANENAQIANDNASTALTKAQSLDKKLAESLTQKGIFDALTNNGEVKGLFMQDGQVYINGTYIQAGTVAADFLTDTSGRYSAIIGRVDTGGTGWVQGISYLIDGNHMYTISSILAGESGYPAALYIHVPNSGVGYATDVVNINQNGFSISNAAYATNWNKFMPNAIGVPIGFGANASGLYYTENGNSYSVYRTPGNVESLALRYGFKAFKNGTCVTVSGADTTGASVPGNWGTLLIGTLPVGWRPPCTVFAVDPGIETIYLQVEANGEVRLANRSATAFAGNAHVSVAFCAAN